MQCGSTRCAVAARDNEGRRLVAEVGGRAEESSDAYQGVVAGGCAPFACDRMGNEPGGHTIGRNVLTRYHLGVSLAFGVTLLW